MKAIELRRLYIDFFTKRGHKEIACASLFPENDPTVLFTTAGMHPLVPYLLGERHPMGQRLVNVQKCVRTDDIDEVGDPTHHTCFEMLGNWSLGDYFKREAVEMSYAFLTQVLQIPPARLAVTVFAGTPEIPRDTQAYDCWRQAGLQPRQIYAYGLKENWWGPVGNSGPCGPDTEIFYDTDKAPCGEGCGPACCCGKYVEIWNNVFLEYNRLPDGNLTPLAQKNVDTGMGLERVLAIMNGKNDNYETELFRPILEAAEALTGTPCTEENLREYRIITDHIRAICFILGDDRGVAPGNTQQGYILRRLIRRSIRLLRKMGVAENILPQLAQCVITVYAPVYPELERNREFILAQLALEYQRFSKTLDAGLRMAEKVLDGLSFGATMDGETAFRLYDTYGFPIEFSVEIAAERGIHVDAEGFQEQLALHQAKSRSGAERVFQGGLSDHSQQTARLHTATHLLHAALRRVLGEEVYQKGSNITGERLRFDFSFPRKLTQEELAAVADIVNQAIAAQVDVRCDEMTVEQAREQGAIGLFGEKYGEMVKLYTIAGYSKEICGGPHAQNTEELGRFAIQKESSVSAGVRRIKAVIAPDEKRG